MEQAVSRWARLTKAEQLGLYWNDSLQFFCCFFTRFSENLLLLLSVTLFIFHSTPPLFISKQMERRTSITYLASKRTYLLTAPSWLNNLPTFKHKPHNHP